MNCIECGVFNKERNFCLKFKKDILDIGVLNDCPYFFKIMYDGNERLSPEEHLYMQDEEFKRKKMQGPM